MPVLRVVAADEGIEALKLMDQALFQEKFQGPVDGGRRGPPVAVPQLIQDGISADRLVAVPNQFKHFAPKGRQTRAALLAERFGLCQCFALAMLVIMGSGCPYGRIFHLFKVRHVESQQL